jgi:uncharacterized protein DUF6851/vanadium-dependent haloperoxidase-like protein
MPPPFNRSRVCLRATGPIPPQARSGMRSWPPRVRRTVERLKRVKHKLAATLVVVAALVAATATTVTGSAPAANAANGPAWPIDTYGTPRPSDNVVLLWNEQLLNTIRRNPKITGPTVAARAIGILNTAIYDAWAPYDPMALGTRLLSQYRQPAAADTLANKNEAISYAAYRVLTDLFKDSTSLAAYNQQMSDLHYSIDTATTDTTTPQGIGNVTAQAEIDFRHTDGSNQLGNDPGSTTGVPYSDTTGYQPVNTWDTVNDPWKWQPLCVPVVTSGTPCPSTSAVQQPYTPQWGKVTPFGLDPATHMPYELETMPGLRKNADGSYDTTDIDQALRDTSNLTDAQKVTAEYWADGPGTAFPPGHMVTFAEALSRMRSDTLDQDVKLFFALGNGQMDASIACWNVKYLPSNNTVRPITAIRERYKNQLINSWLGPGNGYGQVLGQNWIPYQATNVVTPPFPEYVSGHSTFTAAGRTILALFFGTDNFNAQVTIPAGSSKIEPGITPRKTVVLTWKTLTDAADQAGMSRRWGGIHFQTGDMDGRTLGKVVGNDDWNKAQTFFNGTATAPA